MSPWKRIERGSKPTVVGVVRLRKSSMMAALATGAPFLFGHPIKILRPQGRILFGVERLVALTIFLFLRPYAFSDAEDSWFCAKPGRRVNPTAHQRRTFMGASVAVPLRHAARNVMLFSRGML